MSGELHSGWSDYAVGLELSVSESTMRVKQGDRNRSETSLFMMS